MSTSPQRPALPWRRRLAYALLPLLLLLGAVEGAARVWGRAVLRSRQAELSPIPYPESVRRAVEVDPEAELSVMCVGDSWTFGIQLPPELSYPGQLEAALREQWGLRAQVFNLGKPGSSSYRAARMVRSQLPRLPADLIVLQVGANADVLAYEDEAEPGGLFVWSLRSGLRHLASYRLLAQLVARGRVAGDARLHDLEVEAQPMGFTGNEAALRRTLAVNIGLVHALALASDAQLLLLTYGLPPSVYRRCQDSIHVVNDWVREIAAQRGLPLVDMGQLYVDRNIPATMTLRGHDQVPCSQLDPHPDASGYQLYARELGAWIAEHREELASEGR